MGQGLEEGFPALYRVRLAHKVHRSRGQRIKDPQVKGGDEDDGVTEEIALKNQCR